MISAGVRAVQKGQLPWPLGVEILKAPRPPRGLTFSKLKHVFLN